MAVLKVIEILANSEKS